MAVTKYTDIFDPETLMKLVGEQWLNMARFTKAGIIRRDPRPMQGTLTTIIRQFTFQDSKGQALKMNDPISTVKKEQEAANNPRIWRSNGISIPDITDDIEAKNIPQENANMAAAISLAASEYLDDSGVAALEGISGALTGNNTDVTGSGSKKMSLANLVLAKAKTLDKINQLDGGGLVMNSVVYNNAFGLGVVSNSTNTFGNKAQDDMVVSGQLPVTIVGLTPIVTDKILTEGSNVYNTYLVGTATFVVRGDSAPFIELQRPNKKMVTDTLFRINYGLGQDTMKWGLSGKEDVSDTELSTSGNWTLATKANSNDVAIYQLKTDET